MRKRCLSSLVTKFVTFSSLLSPSLSPFFLVSLLTFSSRPHHCDLYGHHQVTAGRWHQVQVHRKLRNGSLQLDDQVVNSPAASILIVFSINYARLSIFYHQPRQVVSGFSPGATRGLNIRTHLYVGGVDSQIVSLIMPQSNN